MSAPLPGTAPLLSMTSSEYAQPAPTGRRERQRLHTRSRILIAAMELFRERGYTSVTIDDIVDEAGVAPRTFYRYFPAKEELVISFHSGAFDEFIAEVERGAASSGHLEVVRRAWLNSLVSQDLDLMATRFQIMSASPALQAKLHERRLLWASRLAATLLAAGHFGGNEFIAEFFSRCVLLASECAIEHHDELLPGRQYNELFDAAMRSMSAFGAA